MKNSMSEKPRIFSVRGVHKASCLIASVSCGVQHLLGTAAQCIAVNTIQIVFHSLFSPFRFTVLRGRAVRLSLPGFGVPGDAARRFPHRGNTAEPHADFFCQCVGVRAARPAQSRLQDQSRSPRIRSSLVVENGMINEAMLIIFAKMQKEKEFYMCVGRMEGQNSFREMVETGIRSLLTGMIEEKMKGKVLKNQWLTPERIAAYYSQTMTYIMMTWIESGMEISPEELVEVYGFMITRSLADVLADI